MFTRPFWLERIEAAWKEAPIAWLCGVRRRSPHLRARANEVGHQLLEFLGLTGGLDLDLVEEIFGKVNREFHGATFQEGQFSVEEAYEPRLT